MPEVPARCLPARCQVILAAVAVAIAVADPTRRHSTDQSTTLEASVHPCGCPADLDSALDPEVRPAERTLRVLRAVDAGVP